MKNCTSNSLPIGFRAYAARAGLYPDPKRLDLALFVSDKVCGAAAVFTSNVVKAAPVLESRQKIQSGRARAILANSGCANACTGARGLNDARTVARAAAREFRIPESEILVASTGVIGKYLPVGKMGAALKEMSRSVGKIAEPDGARAARAILTTDTVPKISSVTFPLAGERVTIWGCAKGAGMIHPNMATMLSFIFTDAQVDPRLMRSMLKRAADQSFNALSVDGDTSTNDTVFFLANGMSGVQVKERIHQHEFEEKLCKIARSLANQIAADGEGATSRVDITVQGARTDRDAKKIAATIATSPLVKTAVFGRDANWGRILAAAGRAGVPFNPDKVDVFFGSLCVAKSGGAHPFSETKAKKILSEKIVPITIDLRQGKGRAAYVTCDFSIDYIKINADYRT